MSIWVILIILLLIFGAGAYPTWGYNHSWGYGPVGGIGLILFVLVILLVMGLL
jgi:hypothetical protein